VWDYSYTHALRELEWRLTSESMCLALPIQPAGGIQCHSGLGCKEEQMPSLWGGRYGTIGIQVLVLVLVALR